MAEILPTIGTQNLSTSEYLRWGARDSATAANAIALSGKANSLIKEDNLQMADDAKVVGGHNVEFGGELITAGGDFMGAGAFSLGENSSVTQTVMDEATRDVLKTYAAMVGSNVNNMMTLAAGRDPDQPLADESVEIVAEVVAEEAKRGGVSFWPVVVVVVVAIAVWWWRKKK